MWLDLEGIENKRNQQNLFYKKRSQAYKVMMS